MFGIGEASGVFLIVMIGLYFLPTILVIQKTRHTNKGGVFVTNLFFGWTLIGWVFALAWSLSNKR
jgi:hypothetical protein